MNGIAFITGIGAILFPFCIGHRTTMARDFNWFAVWGSEQLWVVLLLLLLSSSSSLLNCLNRPNEGWNLLYYMFTQKASSGNMVFSYNMAISVHFVRVNHMTFNAKMRFDWSGMCTPVWTLQFFASEKRVIARESQGYKSLQLYEYSRF